MTRPKRGNEQVVLSSPLDRWEITLASGDQMTVWAHGMKQDRAEYVFVALVGGTPNYEVELSRVPMAAVTDVIGG